MKQANKPESRLTRPEETKTRQVMIYLPPVLIAKVHQAARDNYRSISGEVAYILEQYFKQHPEDTSDCK